MTTVEVLATGTGLLAGCLIFRNTLDPRRIFNLPVKVNCWFCCHDARIPYRSQKAWTCPRTECSQFNGFESDGGYSKEIAEQHTNPDETIGVQKLRYAQKIYNPACDENPPLQERQNVLCRTCNLNQDLKIHQLKTFVPKNEADYDKEIEEFEAHLERTYRLCRYCEASLHQKLGEEDSWLRPKLLGWKLERNRQSPLSSANNAKITRNDNLNSIDKIADILFRMFLVLASLFVSLLTTWELNYFYTFASISSGFISRTFGLDIMLPEDITATNDEILKSLHINTKLFQLKGFRQDVAISTAFILVLGGSWYFRTKVYELQCYKLCLASWTVLIIQAFLLEQQLIEIPESFMSVAPIACIITSFIVGTITIQPKRKKRQHQPGHYERNERPSNLDPHWEWNNKQSHESLLDDTLTQDLVSTSTPVGSVVASNSLSVSHLSGEMPTIAPSRLNVSNHSYGNSQADSLLSENEGYEREILSGKHCDISTLRIGNNNKSKFVAPDLKNIDTLSVVSGAFSLKRYDVTNRSGIDFGDLPCNRVSEKGPLIKPSKFRAGNQKRVVKSSWVAGGYWLNNKYQQNKMSRNNGCSRYDLPETLSNSSSQSSGFVSYSGQPIISKSNGLFVNPQLHQLSSETNANVFSQCATDIIGPFQKKEKRNNTFETNSQCNLENSKYNNSFSLNPICEQLAFFDTSSSSKYGHSRANSPLLIRNQHSLQVQPDYSKMSPNISSFNDKDKECGNMSFNSSLNGLTQEKFLELRPKAESSPVVNDRCSQSLPRKSWMEKKLTINISVYSIVLVSSVAANIALIIYFML